MKNQADLKVKWKTWTQISKTCKEQEKKPKNNQKQNFKMFTAKSKQLKIM